MSRMFEGQLAKQGEVSSGTNRSAVMSGSREKLLRSTFNICACLLRCEEQQNQEAIGNRERWCAKVCSRQGRG